MTQITVQKLQEKINEAAERRLKQDLFNLYETLAGNRLVNNSAQEPHLEFNYKDEKGESKRDSSSLYWLLRMHNKSQYGNSEITVGGHYAEALYDHFLPIYIKEETEMFINKVNDILVHLPELNEELEKGPY